MLLQIEVLKINISQLQNDSYGLEGYVKLCF